MCRTTESGRESERARERGVSDRPWPGRSWRTLHDRERPSLLAGGSGMHSLRPRVRCIETPVCAPSRTVLACECQACAHATREWYGEQAWLSALLAGSPWVEWKSEWMSLRIRQVWASRRSMRHAPAADRCVCWRLFCAVRALASLCLTHTQGRGSKAPSRAFAAGSLACKACPGCRVARRV